MSRVVVVRYRTSAQAAEENAALVAAVYEELAQSRPAGLRYATYRLGDGTTFLHVAHLDGDDNPLARSPAFAAFQKELGQRCVEGPEPQEATVVGSYRAGP